VINKSKSTDDQLFHTVLAEKLEQILEILDGLHSC
jgi:hypothetical protein